MKTSDYIALGTVAGVLVALGSSALAFPAVTCGDISQGAACLREWFSAIAGPLTLFAAWVAWRGVQSQVAQQQQANKVQALQYWTTEVDKLHKDIAEVGHAKIIVGRFEELFLFCEQHISNDKEYLHIEYLRTINESRTMKEIVSFVKSELDKLQRTPTIGLLIWFTCDHLLKQIYTIDERGIEIVKEELPIFNEIIKASIQELREMIKVIDELEEQFSKKYESALTSMANLRS